MLTIFLISLNFYTVFCNPVPKDTVCYKGCHPIDKEKMNVHLIPHSHDDVGWLRTYQEYYDGSGMLRYYVTVLVFKYGHLVLDRQEVASVKFILDSTVQALNENSNRRFIQVETSFFWKWWTDQTEKTRNIVRNLVNKGRLEMINGGWSMNDEAATNYQSIIDQFTWGFRVIEDTVGKCGRPKIGWQIDPFGHSREHASLLKQLGFEGLVLGRIDYRDKKRRIREKNLDFMWNTNDNFEETGSLIFATMFPDSYSAENGFCFDVTCPDPDITDSNLVQKVADFTTILNKYSAYYKTRNILMPMGQDFTYQQAEKNFNNTDKLIRGFEKHDIYNVMYSTPSCYIQAVKEEVARNNIDLTIKTDDFFPYASGKNSFWTGYFTSRPTSKRFERIGNNIFQSAKQLATFSRIRGNDYDHSLSKLKDIMGVMQHHDAITGTEKQAVADNYHFLLHQAIKEAEKAASNIIRDLLTLGKTDINLNLSTCLLTNVSICETTKKDRFLVAVHNPLSKVVSHYVRLPVDGENYKITGPEDDGDIKFDIFDALHSFDFVTNAEPASKELVFLAKHLPPLGIKLYYVEKVEEPSGAYHKFEDLAGVQSFGDETNGFSIGTDGKLKTVTIKGDTHNITQEFLYYKSAVGSNLYGNDHYRSSGSYIFSPEGNAVPISKNVTKIKFAKGTCADEVLQVVNEEVSQIIRLYKEENYIEFDWLVGNLKLNTQGKEVITRFTIKGLKNNATFYTDSNGRQQIKRIRNKRNDFAYNSTEEPVSSNYYPVTSRIVIKDNNLEVGVLNDRAQGGTSLEDGQIELMIHRRIADDDGYGVNEALDEKQYGKGLYARGQHYLTFGGVVQRDLVHRKLLAPWVLVGDASSEDLSLDKVKKYLLFEFQGLTVSLPDNVKILTLEPWKDSYLLRLEHIFEKEEDEELSKDAVVNLSKLFRYFNIVELTQLNLGANGDLVTKPMIKVVPNLKIALKPMEIKTFIFKTDENNAGGHNVGVLAVRSGSQTLSSVYVLVTVLMISYLLFQRIIM